MFEKMCLERENKRLQEENIRLQEVNECITKENCHLIALIKDYERRIEYMKKHDCYIAF